MILKFKFQFSVQFPTKKGPLYFYY